MTTLKTLDTVLAAFTRIPAVLRGGIVTVALAAGACGGTHGAAGDLPRCDAGDAPAGACTLTEGVVTDETYAHTADLVVYLNAPADGARDVEVAYTRGERTERVAAQPLGRSTRCLARARCREFVVDLRDLDLDPQVYALRWEGFDDVAPAHVFVDTDGQLHVVTGDAR